MSALRLTLSRPATKPGLAATGYALLVLVLLAVAWDALADLARRRADFDAAAQMLARLDARRVPPQVGADAAWSGSPFIEGPTVTVAGAALMQRVTSAVARFGGRIMSSRVELQGAPLGPGFIGVTVDFEIAEPDLQRLLYDLEAGQPFLFLAQVAIQTADRDGEAARLRGMLTAYGQWQRQP